MKPSGPTVRPHAECQAALSAFIAEARSARHPNIPYGDFDDLRWPIACNRKRGRKHHDAIVFTTSSARIGQKPEPFPEPFASFARALIQREVRLRFELGTIDPFRSMTMALRYLHAALPTPTTCPTALKSTHFARAETAIWAEHTTRAAQNQIYALKRVKRAVEALKITPGAIEWDPDTSLATAGVIGPELEALRRAELLITEEELRAVATLSVEPGPIHRNRILQRAVDLLACGAFRVGEVCALPLDTLVERPLYTPEGDVALDDAGQPVVQYGLRYWPEKGGRGETLLRPIPTVMAPLAKRAVAELKALTGESRRVALAHHEGRSPFEGAPWGDLPGDTLLRPDQVAAMLGLGLAGGNAFDIGRRFILSRRLPSESRSYTNAMNRTFDQPWVRKKTIDAFVRSLSFTQTCIDAENNHIALHECLLIVPYYARGEHPGFRGTAVPVDSQMVATYLSSEKESHSGFRRRGLAYAASGNEVRVTSNMFRYWIDTAALQGGLGHYDVARWMGRAKIAVNRAYDLRNDAQRADYLREIAASTLPSAMDFTAAARLDDETAGSAGHVTRAGLCRSSFTAPPCRNFLDSIERGLFAADLADLPAQDLAEISTAMGKLLASAEDAFEDGHHGAGTWVALQRRVVTIIQEEHRRRGATIAAFKKAEKREDLPDAA